MRSINSSGATSFHSGILTSPGQLMRRFHDDSEMRKGPLRFRRCESVNTYSSSRWRLKDASVPEQIRQGIKAQVVFVGTLPPSVPGSLH